VLRYRDREARIARDGRVWWATFRYDDGRPPMPGIWFEQLDAAGIDVMVKTLAGFFDAELSRPDG